MSVVKPSSELKTLPMPDARAALFIAGVRRSNRCGALVRNGPRTGDFGPFRRARLIGRMEHRQQRKSQT
jgi:hypothetical protein